MSRGEQLWRFSRAYVAPLWRWYAAGTVAVLATNAMSVRVPIELAAGLDALRAGSPEVATAAWHVAALGVAILVARTASRLWFFTPGRIAEFHLREDLFAKAMVLQPSFYAAHPTGDLIARMTSDVTYARAFAGFATLQVLNVVAALVMATSQMLALSPTLTLACAVPIALGFLAVQQGIGRMFGLQKQAQAQTGALSDELLGALQGVATVQAFDVEDVFVTRVEARATALRDTNLAMARLRALVFPLLTVAGGAAVGLLLLVGGPMALAGTLSAGQIAAFVGLVAYVLVPLRLLGVLVPVFQRTEAVLERIHAVLDAPVERPEGDTPVPYPSPGHGPAVEVRDLDFAYPDAAERPVLHGLRFTLPAGATVGIQGATGAGKSTLLRVLARLYNPPRGTVFIDGVDVTTLDLATWRQHLTLVAQSPQLLGDSVRENIGFGADDDAVLAAAHAAALGPDLTALPDGLATVVGERGIMLSGGQRQRVALARACLRTTEVVLLDDVLSAVDHTTEQELIATLQRRKSGSEAGVGAPTRVLASHRMSALATCDLVLVLEDGRLVDQGTHTELLQRDGPYRDAWRAQQGSATEEASA